MYFLCDWVSLLIPHFVGPKVIQEEVSTTLFDKLMLSAFVKFKLARFFKTMNELVLLFTFHIRFLLNNLLMVVCILKEGLVTV